MLSLGALGYSACAALMRCVEAEHHRIAQTGWQDDTFAVSPDGRTALSSRTGDKNLWITDLTSGKSRPLVRSTDTHYTCPAFSPDGRTVVCSARSDLYLLSSDGSSIRRLTDDPYTTDIAPSFSADGRWITFVRFRNNPFSPTGVRWVDFDVWMVSTDGRETRQLTRQRYLRAGSPQFRPDGASVVFSAIPRQDAMDTTSGIFEVSVAGRSQPEVVLSDAWAGADSAFPPDSPCLSPDGQQIAFLADKGTPYQSALWTMDRNGKSSRLLPMHSLPNPPYAIRYAPDGKSIYFMIGSELWRVPVTGGRPTLITR
jgi:Tol biopolymer transport system component